MDAATVLIIMERWCYGGGSILPGSTSNNPGTLVAWSKTGRKSVECCTFEELATHILELIPNDAGERPHCAQCREIVESNEVERTLEAELP